MQVHHEPQKIYADKPIPPRTWVELDDEELAVAIRAYAEANGVQVPGPFVLRQRDYRTINGVAMIVDRDPQLRLVK